MTPPIQQTQHGAKIGDVEFIWARNSQEFLFSNSILVHGDKPVIVDPSASFTYIAELARAHVVKTVLNTHYHGDHRSLNHLFRDAVFACHEADAKAITDFDYYEKLASDDDQSYYRQWIREIFKKYKINDCPVSLKLKDGDIIDTGTERIRMIHTPGHTPGHCALFFEKADILFVADIDLTPYGPWYASPASSIEQFKASIKKVRDFECTYYVPSHGERIYDRAQFLEKIDRYSAYFDQRDEKILSLLNEKPMDMATLCSHGIVYKTPSLADPLKCYFQFEMVRKHVEILVRDGKIRQDGEKLLI